MLDDPIFLLGREIKQQKLTLWLVLQCGFDQRRENTKKKDDQWSVSTILVRHQ